MNLLPADVDFFLKLRAGCGVSPRPAAQLLPRPTNRTITIMKTTIATLSALAIATSLSFAQDKPPGPPKGADKHPSPEEIFKKIDTDKNGSINLEEFKASPRGQKDAVKAEEIFKKIDADKDGNVTPEEFKAKRPPRAPGKAGKGGKGGKGEKTPPAPPAPPAAE
jgi:hypothetical protein